jgi:hypothetical protein
MRLFPKWFFSARPSQSFERNRAELLCTWNILLVNRPSGGQAGKVMMLTVCLPYSLLPSSPIDCNVIEDKNIGGGGLWAKPYQKKLVQYRESVAIEY